MKEEDASTITASGGYDCYSSIQEHQNNVSNQPESPVQH